MMKKIAWSTFKNTGNIDTFLEYKKIEDIESRIQKKYDEREFEEKVQNSEKN